MTQVKEEVLNDSPSARYDTAFFMVWEILTHLIIFRTGASFSADTERDEFILFGGEYYDGSKVLNKIYKILTILF